MLTSILGKIGLPILIEFVTQALGGIDNPVARNANTALKEVKGALVNGSISPEQMIEANRHAETIAEINMKEFEVTLAQINESLRAEIASEDKYVRRMRPTFGYLMAGTWAAQMFGLAYIIVFETEKAAYILQSTAALSTIWAVGLSVLGVYVYKRSEDKKILSNSFLPKTILPKRKPSVSRETKEEQKYQEYNN